MGQIKQAVIFAGGQGERLRPVTDNIPKPMAPVNGVPFSDYLLQTLIDVGITKVCFLVGYKHEKIIEYYSKINSDKLKFEFSIGRVEDLTGKRLIDAYSKLDNNFLALYGDNYWPIELEKMEEIFFKKQADALITSFANLNGTGEYGKQNNVKVSSDNLVLTYDETRKNEDLNGLNLGYMLIKKNSLPSEDHSNKSIEDLFLKKQINKKTLVAHTTEQQYRWITTLENLNEFEKYTKQYSIQHFKR